MVAGIILSSCGGKPTGHAVLLVTSIKIVNESGSYGKYTYEVTLQGKYQQDDTYVFYTNREFKIGQVFISEDEDTVQKAPSRDTIVSNKHRAYNPGDTVNSQKNP